MSVLADVLASLPGILQGTAGDSRIPTRRFEIVDTSRSLSPGMAARAPYPVHIWLETAQTEMDGRCDMSGNYVYHDAEIVIAVYYADKPNDRVNLLKTVSDDNLALTQALTWPLNWAIVPGWVGAEYESEIVNVGGDDAPQFVANLVTLAVTIRESKT